MICRRRSQSTCQRHGKKMCGILYHFHTHFRNKECVEGNLESNTGHNYILYTNSSTWQHGYKN